MIGRAWRRATRNWREAAAIIAEEQTGWDKTPVPPLTRGGAGQIPGAGGGCNQAVTPLRPAPGTGHHRGDHMVIDIWACGCIYTWTVRTGWMHDNPCLGEELRKLAAP